MKIRIDALDTLFFRDGKPFTSGEDLWANMQFPPLPSVIYGALHSAYLAELIRTWQPTPRAKTLRIKAIALQDEDDLLLFPAPLDYVKRKGHNEQKKGVLLKEIGLSSISNCPINTVLASDVNMIIEPIENGYFDSNDLSAYLRNKEDDIEYKDISQYFQNEPKIGIERHNATHAAQEHMLYSIEMQRLEKRVKDEDSGTYCYHKLALFVEYEGLSLRSPGMLRLGGEGKAAAYRPSNAVLPTPPTLRGNRFKLYLATPAIFQAGWRPNWLQATTLQGNYGHLELKLVTAIIGKPIAAGGFSVEHNRPKPMRKAVPAGSIYVFEIINGSGTMQDALTLFHGKILSDSGVLATLSDEQKQLPQQGFGLTFVGGVE